MKISILSRYSRLGASSRLRTLQYVSALERAGNEVSIMPFFDDDYIRDLYSGTRKPLRTLGYYWRRLRQCRTSQDADLIWIEKEVLPWLPWVFENIILPRKVPYIVDYDDAVFHRYDLHQNRFIRSALGKKIDRVMANAAAVTAGNSYLAARAITAGAKDAQIIPTVVDLQRYDTSRFSAADGALRVGWIGTPQTWKELAQPTQSALASDLSSRGVIFRAVGAELQERWVPGLEILPWSEETEVSMIQGMDIGIMPLTDTPWTRGKCGYKLIQYMACGVPVVASPIGVNKEIVQHGVNGFLAETEEDWRSAIIELIEKPKLRRRMGAMGRKLVEQHYSLQIWAPKVAELIYRVGAHRHFDYT